MTIIGTPSAPHPQAQLIDTDHVAGVITFAWLDASGARVDSGNSLAHFTPGANPPGVADYTSAITVST